MTTLSDRLAKFVNGHLSMVIKLPLGIWVFRYLGPWGAQALAKSLRHCGLSRAPPLGRTAELELELQSGFRVLLLRDRSESVVELPILASRPARPTVCNASAPNGFGVFPRCVSPMDLRECSTVSSHTPVMGAMPQLDRENVFQVVSSNGRTSHLQATSIAFEPRRSSLVSWTVRIAQVADRILAHAFPASGVATERADGFVEKTLNGLDRCCRLIPTHQGVVAAERARLQIQQVLQMRRARFQRFQQMRRSQKSFHEPSSYLYLNPVCRWIRISEEAVSQQQECLSGSVLFFLADGDVHGLRMNLEGQVLINELADYQPCTILDWAQLSSLADLQQLERLVRELADIGLVAWSRE